jgi:hypothetical protein
MSLQNSCMFLPVQLGLHCGKRGHTSFKSITLKPQIMLFKLGILRYKVLGIKNFGNYKRESRHG